MIQLIEQDDVAKKNIMKRSDICTIKNFLQEYFEIDHDAYVDKIKVKELFKQYYDINNIYKKYSSIHFGVLMHQNCIISYQIMEKCKRKMVWKGIKTEHTV